MGRTPCCSAEDVKKGAWTSDEDKKLIAYIEKHGEGGWRTLPQNAGLQRCGKSCRLRWTNYLRPDIKRGEFSPEEEQKIIELHATLGNRWSAIAKQLAKRTDNEIKNYWNTHLKKRLAKTKEPKCKLANCTKPSSSTNGQPNSTHRNQNNNANYVTNHSSQDDTGAICQHADMDPPRDILSNVMPRSASAKLLNRLATRLPSSYCLDILKNGPFIQSPSTQFHGKDVVSDSDYTAGSSSARSLLNKMARGINRPTVYLEMVKSVLFKSSNVGSDTSTSVGDDLFYTSATNGQTWMQPTASMSIETAENLASGIMVEDVPSRDVQNDQNGNGSIELLTEDLDLDFLQNWTMMDDDHDTGTGVIGGGSYEVGVTTTCINSDSHSIESAVIPSIFVNSFEPESAIHGELSDFMNFY